MTLLYRFASILRWLFRRDRAECDLNEELEAFVEIAARDRMRTGAAPAEARRLAALDLGGVEQTKELIRAGRHGAWLDALGQDIRYGIRQVRRNPAFSLVAVATLALGIGANTAIFTLFEVVMWRTVPLPRPHELHFLGHDPGPRLSTSSNYPLYERYQQLEAFRGVTASWGSSFRVADASGTEIVTGAYVSGNYHAVLEVPMALGRGFTSEPDRDPSRQVAVISGDYWARKFGCRPDILGETLLVNGRAYTIVGITRAFTGLAPGRTSHIVLPMSARALEDPGFFDAYDGWLGNLTIIGRLKAERTVAAANAQADAVFQQFMREPENVWARNDLAPEFQGTVFVAATLVPASRGADGLRAQYGTPIRLLLAIVAIVLVIACANVANLLLTRATSRQKEIAIRLSMGAGRLRIVRQLLTESALLAALGGAGGLLLAIWSAQAIAALFAVGQSPLHLDVWPNRAVLAFTALISVGCTLAFGVVPALRATQVRLTPALKDTSDFWRSRPGRRVSLGKLLVVGQVALSVVVVAGAALLGRSLLSLQTFDAGFERTRVLLFTIETPAERFDAAQRVRFYDELLERLRARPGVIATAYSLRTPVDTSTQVRRFQVPGGLVRPGAQGVSVNVVTPEYFRVFGIPLLAGRSLSSADTAAAPRVAVAGQRLVRAFFGDGDPIGRSVILGGDTHPITIVGVVGDVLHERLRAEQPTPMLYTPLMQYTGAGVFDAQPPGDRGLIGPAVTPRLTAEIRTASDPAALTASIAGEARSLDKAAIVSYVRTMADQVDGSVNQERVLARLSLAFAALATMLTSVGLFGVMSYTVLRRTKEIGIRVALGATRIVVLSRVLGDAVVVAMGGIVLGLAVAIVATRVLARFLFGLSPHDPATLGATATVLFVTMIAAAWLPARRAATIDPMHALRSE